MWNNDFSDWDDERVFFVEAFTKVAFKGDLLYKDSLGWVSLELCHYNRANGTDTHVDEWDWSNPSGLCKLTNRSVPSKH